MVSIQMRLLEIFLLLTRLFSDRSGKLDVAKERADVEEMTRMFKPLGKFTHEAVAVNGLKAEWIVPPEARPERVMLFLHGGSFNAGSIASHRTLAGNVALACQARVLLLDYRLAPEHPFPAAIEDAIAAYEWLLAQGIPARQVIAAGDSAGGNLGLELLLHLRDHKRPLPSAAVCLSPSPDLTFSSPSWTTNLKKDLMLDIRKERKSLEIYLKGVDPRDPRVSPSYANLEGLPPLLLQVGSYELLRSDVEQFAEKARAAGVEVTLEVWPGMQHEWHFAADFLPEGRQAVARIGAFVEAIYARVD